MKTRERWLVLTMTATFAASGVVSAGESEGPLAEAVASQTELLAGVCVQIGGSEELTARLAANPRLLLHRLDDNPGVVDRLQRRFRNSRQGATVLVEHWAQSDLPHADNSVNRIIAADPKRVSRDEIIRVLVPGGTAVLGTGEQQTRMEKPWPEGTRQWTHQWGDAEGVPVGEDRIVGIPEGLQWLAGPVHVMGQRKSSTQAMVSGAGLNFYITVNVFENVGLPTSEMAQYLVARDAFNGMIRWTREWEGPFVRVPRGSKTGQGEVNPRLVASDQTLYAVDQEGLLAINPCDGEIRGSVVLDHPPDKLVYSGGTLLAQSEHGLRAFGEQLEGPLWEFGDRRTHGTVVSGSRVFLLVSGREESGAFDHELVCLDLSTGNTLWRNNIRSHIPGRNARIHFAQDGVVALVTRGSLHLFGMETCEHFWSRDTDAFPQAGYLDERYVGHFYRHGLVWMKTETSPRERDGQTVWLGLDPKTGLQKQVLRTEGLWPRGSGSKQGNLGCSMQFTLDRYSIIPRQSTYIDLETGEKSSFPFLRGGCGPGLIAANGLIYSLPHACGCSPVWIHGLLAAHGQEVIPPVGAARRLQAGPAVSGQRSADVAQPEDWPMHRYDVLRGAASPVELDDSLTLQWSVEIAPESDAPANREWEQRIGAPVTAPTILGERVFVADVNRGRLVCLDRKTGREHWSFTAGGRIDTPPTIHEGLCLFGARDGYVYALDAGDGRLAWRFLAAPTERRIIAFGHLESRWPVAGTVLVQDNTVFAAAGRAPGANGGMHVHALEPASGTPQWSVNLSDAERFEGQCDYLVGNGQVVFLSNWQFLPDGTHQRAQSNKHLRGGKVGLLEPSWTKLDLASRKGLQTWTARGNSGQILAFSPEASASYHGERRRLSFRADSSSSWDITLPSPAQITALALTAKHVVAAGSKNRNRDADGGMLWLLDRQDGQIRQELSFPTAASFDGIAVAHRQVFVSTGDGRVFCFGP